MQLIAKIGLAFLTVLSIAAGLAKVMQMPQEVDFFA